jgi:AraC-like DNA-binding protein
LTAVKGDIIYIPQDFEYSVKVIVPGSKICIDFKLESLENHDLYPTKYKLNHFPNAVEQFRMLEKTWTEKKTGYLLLTKSIIYNILYLIKKEEHERKVPWRVSQQLSEAIKTIHKYYNKKHIYISELAGMSGMSDVYFRKQFKAIYGTTPVKYITELKLSYAKELLRSNQYSVKDIAFMCGYEDEYYFSQDFKKNLGLPPSEYLKNFRH